MITLVACTDINMGVGMKDGSLLFNIKKDMAHFKALTTGRIVVMGRKTWDSLPKKPLPKRKNYVLTNDKSFSVKGATKIVNSIDEIVELGKHHDIFVIGGGEVYAQMMPYADKLVMTHVHVIDNKAEVFFPKIEVREWKLMTAEKNDASKSTDNNKHDFTIATYERKNK